MLLASMMVMILLVVLLCGSNIWAYRQVLIERDRLLEERDGRLVDLWKDLEQRDERIAAQDRRILLLESMLRECHAVRMS
jgi:hypothetical protein